MDNTLYLAVNDSTTDNLYPALFQCFTIILCGYVAGRLNWVSQTEAKGIGTFVGTFALPSLIFLSLARLDFSTVNWTFLLAILLAKGFVFFSVILITLLISKPIHLGRAGIFAIFCTQSNDFALGYPIINALYQNSHPEYALYLYLMAPISLAILNPVAFVLMEIGKQKESPLVELAGTDRGICARFETVFRVLKGIVLNPILFMTVLGIVGNVVFKHSIPVYVEGLLQVLGSAFSGSALFLLGLRMVGQFHRLQGPALLLPFVLIMVKLIVLPIAMRESVSTLNAGENASDTMSLSIFAFLYGTIPTAPAVFVFSNQYQLEVDLVASSMVICTFLSAPMMFMSAQMISITKDYAEQIKRFGFDISIVSLVALIWVFIVFTITKKYKRMPHRLTLCLLISQILLALSVIWGGPVPGYQPSWHGVIQQSLQFFSMYSCLLWTSMLAVGLLLLQSRGPCFVVTVWPVLGLIAWGIPAAMVTILLATKAKTGDLNGKANEVIRLSLLVFCLTVTAGSMVLYSRFRRRNAHYASLASDVANGSSPPDESTSLVENAEPTSQTYSVTVNGCYGAITATPSPSKSSNECCSNDPNCNNAGLKPADNEALTRSTDIKDMANETKDCACPPALKGTCRPGPDQQCPYLEELEQAAVTLGLLPSEQTRGGGGQLLKHTVLTVAYTLCMFISITFTTWSMMMDNESGIYVEVEFLDVAACYGQGLILFALFGLDPEEMILPAVRYFKTKWYGNDALVLTPLEDLSFETKHVCDQFITHHLERCKEAIAKDTRWRMKTYHGVFRGSCLSRWLVGCGLAKDETEAVVYGRHLLEGRLITHINNAHHFSGSSLLYTFN